jgi:hypothetical protein
MRILLLLTQFTVDSVSAYCMVRLLQFFPNGVLQKILLQLQKMYDLYIIVITLFSNDFHFGAFLD